MIAPTALHRQRVLTADAAPPIAVNPEGVPQSLTELSRWVCWGWRRNAQKSKWDKPPLKPSGANASTTEPKTWIDFSTAVRTHETTGMGIGFVLNGDGIVGMDLDDCRNPETGELAAWASSIVQTMLSYCEVSPSGTGVKLLVRGTLPDHARSEYPRPDGSKLEVFQTGRYFTITGQRLPGTPDELAERTEQLASVLATADAWKPRNGSKAHHQHVAPSPLPQRGESDRETALSALAVLDPSMGYQDWLRVGMALHSVDSSNAMLQEWDSWSARSEKYVPGECESKWTSFTTGSCGVGLGTLCHLADDTGQAWRPARKSPARQTSRAERPRLAPGTLVRPTDRDNYGTVIDDQGDTITVHFVGREGEAEIEFQPSELRHANGQPIDPTAVPIAEIVTFSQLAANYPRLRPAVIDGLLREGEVANVIAKSKVGKSWLSYSISLCVVNGWDLFGRFRCTPGNVLLIDNELHPENLAHRIPSVAEAMGLQPHDYGDRLHVMSLRGRLMPITDLGTTLATIERGQYSLVVLDALYRMLPDGTSENDNAAMALVYNTVDRYAAQTGAAFVLIHHASKGDQSGKDVTDVGSGAGSQSRAADTHLVLRPHEEENAVVVEAAVRSWKPVEPFGLRWEFPVWTPDDNLDPASLKRQPSKRDANQEAKDADGCGAIVDALREHGYGTKSKIRTWTGMSESRITRLVALMRRDGRLVSRPTNVRGNDCEEYELAEHLRATGGVAQTL